MRHLLVAGLWGLKMRSYSKRKRFRKLYGELVKASRAKKNVEKSKERDFDQRMLAKIVFPAVKGISSSLNKSGCHNMHTFF